MRRIRKREVPKRADGSIGVSSIRGVGSSRTISMSKTRKMTARRKNRRENGVRAEFFGSNPHSNGESFSRSWWDRAAKARAIRSTSEAMRRAIKNGSRMGCMGGTTRGGGQSLG